MLLVLSGLQSLFLAAVASDRRNQHVQVSEDHVIGLRRSEVDDDFYKSHQADRKLNPVVEKKISRFHLVLVKSAVQVVKDDRLGFTN